MIIGGIGTAVAYKMHFWVEKKYNIDDAIGAVAVHGYAGFVPLGADIPAKCTKVTLP